MGLRVIQFLAILLTALALVPAGAHLFELPNKIDMPRDAYLAVQGIYAGWAWFGIVYLAALVMNVVLAIKLRRQLPAVYFAGAAAFASPSSSRSVHVDVPRQHATAKWTTMPDDWIGLRREWEYSHVVNSVVMLIALCSVTLSVITARQD